MIDGQGEEIKNKLGLFMKMNGMLVCGISAGSRSCVGIGVESHSGDTWLHAHAYGFGRVTVYQDKPVSLGCIQRCNLRCVQPILRPFSWKSLQCDGTKCEIKQRFLSSNYRNKMQDSNFLTIKKNHTAAARVINMNSNQT